MIRLLGILLGCVIAVAVLILIVGVPRIVERSEPEGVRVQLPLRAAPTGEAVVEKQSEAEPQGQEEVLPESAAAIAASTPVAAPAEIVEFSQAASEVAAKHAPAEELRWYAFWSPFRSQIAANGFVTQLQRVTGLDYRVVSVKPGVYEVAFAYSDDDEIQINLSQISAATGLDIPES